MDSTIGSRVAPRKPAWGLLAVLWVAFAGLVMLLERAVGCPLAGCSNAGIALAAAIGLAVVLGVLMTHSERVAAHQRALRRR